MVRKIAAVTCAIMLVSGCGMSRVATKAGVKIAQSYQEAASLGIVTAEQSIKDWPYISGLIRGLFAGNYDLDMPAGAQSIMKKLDALAERDTLTTRDKGFIIGSYCRLETMAVKEGWDRYGVSITSAFRRVFGG